jgi:hypothetical protein
MIKPRSASTPLRKAWNARSPCNTPMPKERMSIGIRNRLSSA